MATFAPYLSQYMYVTDTQPKLNQHVTIALNWHMDRYVGKHSLDTLTDSSHLITTWLAHLGEHWSAEGRLRIQTLPGPTLRVFK